MNTVIKTHEMIERNMQIVDDLKKEIHYCKDFGVWYWNNRGDEYEYGPFDTFLDAVADIVNMKG